MGYELTIAEQLADVQEALGFRVGNVSTGVFSAYAAFVTKGRTADLSEYAFAAENDNDLAVATIDNNGRLDLNSYTSGGSVAVLRNYTASTATMTMGHYAYSGKSDAGNLHTAAYLLSKWTNNAEATMSSQLEFGYMDAVNGAPGAVYAYQQPNKFMKLNSTGLELPDIPIKWTAGVGRFNIGSARIRIRAVNTTELQLESVNLAENGFQYLRVDGSILFLNTQTNGAINLGNGAVTFGTGAIAIPAASISMSALPTSNPAVAGRLWNNVGILSVSAG